MYHFLNLTNLSLKKSYLEFNNLPRYLFSHQEFVLSLLHHPRQVWQLSQYKSPHRCLGLVLYSTRLTKKLTSILNYTCFLFRYSILALATITRIIVITVKPRLKVGHFEKLLSNEIDKSQTHSLIHGAFIFIDHISDVCGSIWTFFTVLAPRIW